MLTLSNTTKGSERAPARRETEATEYKAGQRQRCPTHPGAVVRSALEALGVKPNQAALAIGWTRAGLGLLVNEARGITPESAVLLAAYLGTGETGAEHLLAMQADFDLWHTRKRLASRLAKIKPAPRS